MQRRKRSTDTREAHENMAKSPLDLMKKASFLDLVYLYKPIHMFSKF